MGGHSIGRIAFTREELIDPGHRRAQPAGRLERLHRLRSHPKSRLGFFGEGQLIAHQADQPTIGSPQIGSCLRLVGVCLRQQGRAAVHQLIERGLRRPLLIGERSVRLLRPLSCPQDHLRRTARQLMQLATSLPRFA